MSSRALTVTVPTSAADVARMQREAETELVPLCKAFTISTPEEYEAADAILSDVVRQKDAAIAMRKTATAPMYEAVRTVEGWFRPLVKALESCESSLKGGMGAWRVEIARLESAKREAAAVAAETGDAAGLVEALTDATAAGAAKVTEARATVSLVWTAVRVNPALVSHELLAAFAADHPAELQAWFTKRESANKSDAPAIIPGVTFERKAKIGAKR